MGIEFSEKKHWWHLSLKVVLISGLAHGLSMLCCGLVLRVN